MNKQERIIKNIKNDKGLLKAILKHSYTTNEAENIQDFVNNAERYIKAIKQGRVICNIDKVSASGMSRNIKFLECSGKGNNYRYFNFFLLFKMLGYTQVKDTDTFRINGCGMDMIFHTNYSNMHILCRLGFISKKQCNVLAQATPSII